MPLSRKRFTVAAIVLLGAAGMFLALPISLPFKVRTRAMVKPMMEWELTRTQDGNLMQLFRDNLTGTVRNYGVTEFQRGDVMRFELSPTLEHLRKVRTGDTIGSLYSNEEQRKLIQLEGELRVLSAELAYHTTGQKPEDVERAQRELKLAKQELETQRKLMARSEVLLRDSVIPMQQYEIDFNELKVKELAVSIAEARLLSVTTGEKPEQAALIRAKVGAITMQLDQLKARISFLTLLAPVGGMVVMDRYMDDAGSLVRIADTSQLVAVAPIRLADAHYIRVGDRVRTIPLNGNRQATGEVVGMDNVSRTIDRQSAVFVTILFERGADLMPGSTETIELTGMPLTPWSYAVKLFNAPT